MKDEEVEKPVKSEISDGKKWLKRFDEIIGSRELKLDIEEATALKLMLENTIQVFSQDKEIPQEDTQIFGKILAKLL